jgi:ubiquinone/menaquinone biosynthesis C-methylase UbiE
MNDPKSKNKFVPRQALAPSPLLYVELVSDGMENLAKASIAQFPSISAGAVVHDNGCGAGAATAAIVETLSNTPTQISIKGTDINDDALAVYRKQAAEGSWPAEALHMDSTKLSFPDGTFTHSIGNALLFVLPHHGQNAVRETYRTLQLGGIAVFNSWAVVPTLGPIHAAARATRPPDTPLPREGQEHWASADFLHAILVMGGFGKEQVKLVQQDVYATTSELTRFATMLWSFMGGTSTAGWLPSDEENWDRAVEIVKEELQKTDGFRALDGGRGALKFVANIAIASKDVW